MNIGIILTVLDAFCILFVPGFFLSLLFVSKERTDFLGRCVLSFGISISVMPFLVFYLSLVHIAITLLTVTVEGGCIVIISCLFLLIRKVLNKS